MPFRHPSTLPTLSFQAEAATLQPVPAYSSCTLRLFNTNVLEANTSYSNI